MKRHRLGLTMLLALSCTPGWGLHLVIDSPASGEPVFDSIVFEATVIPEEEVQEVVFLVDNQVVGRLNQPPFRVQVDLEDANRAHLFEILATDLTGTPFRALLDTPAVPVDLTIAVELQQLYLTVTRDGERVDDLLRHEFTVVDNGEPQEIVTFERGDIPFVAVLLVDASRSMKGEKLEASLAGARAFAEAMQPLDQAKLTLFNDRVNTTTPFTSFPQVLSAGLTELRAAGGTSLNDNLYLALKLLEARQGRRLVILLTDGVDLTSVLKMRDVLETARRSQSLVYWIRLGEPDPRRFHFSAWRDGDGHRQELRGLEELVSITGGRILTLASIDEATAAFVEILDEIRSQYVIGYYPILNLGNGQWHRIKTKINRPEMEVRTREGYLDF